MNKGNMAVATASAVALLMAWVVPSIIDDMRKVYINSDMMEDLMTLNGVGPKMAKKIIAHRQQNGPFQAPEDIMKVKGIGAALYELNYEQIVVEEI